jgi:hypothetical protein
MGNAAAMTSQKKFLAPLLLAALVLLLMPAAPASAGYPIAKDGKIYACFKTKGRGKGTVRVIRNAKVRCQRKWRKMAWHATARPGPHGSRGEIGAAGSPGSTAEAVQQLEGRVNEMLTRIEKLELAVGSLCGQVDALTDQSNDLVGSMEALNTTLGTLVALFTPVDLPSALPAYDCPSS